MNREVLIIMKTLYVRSFVIIINFIMKMEMFMLDH